MGILNHATVGGTSYNVGDYAALDALCGVDYGWQNGVQTATVASVAVTRNGNRITLNGTANNYAYIRMCGSLVGVAGGEASAAQNISGFTTISGHLYLFKLRLLSGSISYSGTAAYSIAPTYRWASTTTGIDSSTVPEIDSEGWLLRCFTGNGNGVATWLYFNSGAEFTNAEFELSAIDATADNQINRTAGDIDARLSGGYPLSWYGVPAYKRYGNLAVSYFDGVARLNGTYWTNNASTMWSVSNGIQTYGGQTNTSFVNPNAIMKAGHTYRVSAIILSGTVTGTSTSKPAMRYYTRVGTGSVVTTEFTTDLISTTTSATYPIVCDKYMTPASDTQIGFGFWTRSPSQETAETYNDLTVMFLVADISLTGTATQNIAAADTLTATSSHASGSLLTVGGRLYKATQAIAPGETINPGINVTATNVAAQLAALEARIAALEG